MKCGRPLHNPGGDELLIECCHDVFSCFLYSMHNNYSDAVISGGVLPYSADEMSHSLAPLLSFQHYILCEACSSAAAQTTEQ